ncbi:MAG: hypothetical protein ACPGUH_07205 [Winogradskyella sp.]
MQLDELTYLFQHPEAITADQTDALLLKINEYPYFQSLYALHLKGLKLKNSYTYNNALKVTAAHTTDRSVLFDYITSEVFNQNKISKEIKQNSETIKTIEVNKVTDISVNKSVSIDDVLRAQIKATEGVLNPNLFEAKPSSDFEENNEIEALEILDSIKNNDKTEETPEKTPEETLNIGKPLSFNTSENHSFTEWLKITSLTPIIRANDKEEEEEEEAHHPLEDKLAIIDRFISKNPKIKPVTNHQPKPKLVVSNDVAESIMTETLARIYLEQKNYDKAIKSYRILSLTYPEKSGFFADQIKAIQKLKENNI